MNSSSNPNAYRIGRFAFTIPAVAIFAGRSQSIYRVDVSAQPLPPAGFEPLWQQHLAGISSSSPPPGSTERIIRVYDLQPGTRAVLFYDSADLPRLRRLDALRPSGNYVLIVSRGGAQGQEADMETLDKHVLNAYNPEASYGFCVEHGAITSEPGNNEAAQIRFNNPALPDFEIIFSTQTVRQPLELDEMSDIRELRQALTGDGTELNVLSSGPRSVAGLKGLEERLAVTPKNEPAFLRLSWKYPGQSLRSDTPQIMVRAVGRKEHEGRLVEAWESILATLRPVAMSPGGSR